MSIDIDKIEFEECAGRVMGRGRKGEGDEDGGWC